MRFGSVFRSSKIKNETNDTSAKLDKMIAKNQVKILLDSLSSPVISVAGGVNAEEVTSSDGRKALRLRDGNPSTFPGGTPAAFAVRVPDSFEKEVSGQRVRVTAQVRAASGSRFAQFHLSYSTNEVGNSGWIKQTVGSTFETKSFEWLVPPMISGCGDFVGILPGPSGECGVEVASIIVEVLPVSQTESALSPSATPPRGP